MAVIVVVPKETSIGEHRVAITPSTLSKFLKLGAQVYIQHNAGEGLYALDSAYHQAAFISEAKELYSKGEVILKVQPPTAKEVALFKEGALLISFLYPHLNVDTVKKLCEKKITSIAMELIPRISRAQTMDALSSQATVSGYKAVLIAANESRFFFPMLTTAAGSIKPAKVLIIGAGVAGLQAIATAKRLGAIVEAYDVRAESKEQVESLGARFVQTNIQAAGSGGYARELTENEKQQQREVLKKHVAQSDVIITTAGVPGKPAPKIILRDMIEAMKPGSIIVDLMAEMGGNCEMTEAGKIIDHHQVKIIGTQNIYSALSISASEMYSKNISNLLELLIQNGQLSIPWDDAVIKGSVVTQNGQVVHEQVKKMMGSQL